MKNKRIWLGMLFILLAFGVNLLGCASVPNPIPNYYNLGNVTEDNCALVIATRWIGDYSRGLITIDGQGSLNEWVDSVNGTGFSLRSSPAIVRVTPGRHTFGVILYGDHPLSITYDCKAGHGYSLSVESKIIRWFANNSYFDTDVTLQLYETPNPPSGWGEGNLLTTSNSRIVETYRKRLTVKN